MCEEAANLCGGGSFVKFKKIALLIPKSCGVKDSYNEDPDYNRLISIFIHEMDTNEEQRLKKSIC